MGSPNLVTRIGLPALLTRSRTARQVALNLENTTVCRRKRNDMI